MEKKRKYVIIVLSAALLAIAACQKNADADHSMESVNAPVTEVFSEERETAEILSSPKEEDETAQGLGEAGEANETEEIEEIEETYLCSIPELDVELEIPAQLYVYRTDGIRWDWNREILSCI